MDRICKRGRKPQSSACRSGLTCTIIQYFRMKRYILLALSVCQSLVVLAAEAPRKSTDANLFGHVVDRDTHEHIAYASVAVVGTAFGTTTDASGHYFLKNLPVGELTLEVRALGYASGRMTVALERGARESCCTDGILKTKGQCPGRVPFTVGEGGSEKAVPVFPEEPEKQGMCYEGWGKIVTDGKVNEAGNAVIVENAEEVTLYYGIRSSFAGFGRHPVIEGRCPEELLKADFDCTRKSYEAYKK